MNFFVGLILMNGIGKEMVVIKGYILTLFSSVQFVTESCLTLCDPMNHSTPGLLVHHQLLESTQTHPCPLSQ